MDINRLIETLNPANFLAVSIKIFGLVAAMFYIVFAIVIIRQVQVMKKTVMIRDWGFLSLFVVIQLGLGLILLIYDLLIL